MQLRETNLLANYLAAETRSTERQITVEAFLDIRVRKQIGFQRASNALAHQRSPTTNMQ